MLVPDSFSRQLKSKDTLADAIQLKLFMTGKAPNIKFLDRILKVIIKMFNNHPDQTLNSGDEIWLSVVTMLFKMI